VNTASRHLLADLRRCDRALLDDPAALERLMRAAADRAGATVVGALFHRFVPKGVTGVLALAESHFSLHTWPEAGFASMDFYTCGTCDPRAALEVVAAGLRAEETELVLVERGQSTSGASMRVVSRAPGYVVGDGAAREPGDER
jgi:S-adenosylmethionine decarboxylase